MSYCEKKSQQILESLAAARRTSLQASGVHYFIFRDITTATATHQAPSIETIRVPEWVKEAERIAEIHTKASNSQEGGTRVYELINLPLVD